MNRQSNSKITALYCRLSRDGGDEGDSNSIQHHTTNSKRNGVICHAYHAILS